MTWLKRSAIALAALLLIVALFGLWLLRSESGARFALARAQSALDGKLALQHASGTLIGPLTLAGVQYSDPASGVAARIGRVSLDIAPLALLSRRVHILHLALSDIDIALTTPPVPAPVQPAAEFSLNPPIAIVLDALLLEHARISQDGKPLFVADRVDFGGAWTDDGIAVKQLALRAPDGSVDLNGTLATLSGYSGHGVSAFRWRVDQTDYIGTLQATSDGRQSVLALTLTAPIAAQLDATLGQTHELPWTLKLHAPRFDPEHLLPDSTLASLALALDGAGDRTHGAVSGEVVVNDHRVQLEPLRYALAGQTLNIETLTLKSPEAPGSLNASGAIQLDAQPLSAKATLHWDGVELPADLVGQALATHGQLDVGGSSAAFHAEGTLALGPPSNLADIGIQLDGTPQAITLHQLALKQSKGVLDAHGTVTLQPALGWQLEAIAQQLDPGAFAADWRGALDFALTTAGKLTDAGPDATIKLDRLGGSLRQRVISGSADLRVKPDYLVDGTLTLASGKSTIKLAGHGGNQTDATVKLDIATLGDWLPNAQGSSNAEFRLRGHWPNLGVEGHASARQMAVGATRVGALELAIQVADIDKPQGTFTLAASDIAAAGFTFSTLDLQAGGSEAAHSLTLQASGSPLAATLALDGGARNGSWRGTLKTLDLAVKDAPRFTLESPAQLDWDGKAFSAGELCLGGDGPTLCVAGNGGSDGAFAARYRIEALPLALLAALGAPNAPLKFDGSIAGNGDIKRSASGALDGHATLASSKGSIAYPDNATQPLFAYSDLALEVALSPTATQATVRAALDHDGRLDGEVLLSGAPGATQALSGKIDLSLKSLAFVELLTQEVAATKGRLDAHYTLSGTLEKPALSGALTLEDFATEIPAAGLKLHDGSIRLSAQDAEHFVLEGHIGSGSGTLMIAGSGGSAADAPLKATIKGDNFIAADIPAARVVISPDLTIERSAERFKVGGSVAIPKADVDLAKLPGGGVSATSPDVVVTDAERGVAGRALPLMADVTVKFGDDVKLAGFGLDGKLAGQLAVRERPGRVATATGTINVSGTYKAYGQDLNIQTGRLLFAGTPLDNPGLDIQAARVLEKDNITAGLQVRGTALLPVLTVYSTPTMEQSEALSYLITGKPLSSLKSGEGDMLGSAARALGTATGDLLAKGIGKRMGVDDIGVADNAALGGAAFTVGKYLSPKLYMSYGVGVFNPGEVVTLRYLLTKAWNFEAQNATTGSRAGINYRFEK